MDSVIALIAWGLTTLIGAFAGSYLGAYMKKKGENRAIHEDIDRLVDQVKAVTEATKKIEAEISSGIWDRQKRWEMKREVLFAAAKQLAAIDNILRDNAAFRQQGANVDKQPSSDEVNALVHETTVAYLKASSQFEETRSLVKVVCSKETIVVFEQVWLLMTVIASRLTTDVKFLDKVAHDWHTHLMAAQQAIRNELEVDHSPTTSTP